MSFAVIATTIWLTVHTYIGLRFIVPAKLPLTWQIVAWVALYLHAALIPLNFYLGRTADRPSWLPILSWTTYLGMGLIALLLPLLLLRDLGWVGATLIDRLISLIGGGGFVENGPLLPADLVRRGVLLNTLNLGIVGLAGGLLGWGVYQAKKTPKVVHTEVPIQNLPPDLEGFRIVQITDTHISDTFVRSDLQAVVDVVNSLDADIAVMTGDLVDGSVDERRDGVAPLGEMRARYGSFFVTGNHEYYWNGPQWIDEVRRLGLKPLINEHQVIEHGMGRVVVAGVTDHSAGRRIPGHISDPSKAKEGAVKHDVSILLAHQPKSVFAAQKAGYDLMLSGHTHGGQLWGWNYLVAVDQPYISSLNWAENMWVYVSRGAGYWGPPVRVAAPSEVALLTLTERQKTA